MATKKTGRKRPFAPLLEEAKKKSLTFARLKPYNPRKGQPLQKFSAYGIIFEELKGWYLVDAHVGEYLKSVRARPDVHDHPVMAFDVCTPEEAQAINERENDQAQADGKPVPHRAPNIKPRDVRTGTPMGPTPAAAPPKDYDPNAEPNAPPPRVIPEGRRMKAAASGER